MSPDFDLTAMAKKMEEEPGFYPWSSEPQTAMFLYALVCLLQPKVVLELGTFKGFGTLHMLAALRATKGKLITVDTQDYRSSIIRLPVITELYTFLQGRSIDVLPAINETVDFAFIDSVHTEVTVRAELSLLEPKLAAGAVLVFHDTLSFPAVHKAIYTLPGYERVTFPTPMVPGRDKPMSGLSVLRKL